MHSDSSSLEATRIPFSICFIILLKKISIMFNHDACVGVKTNTNLHSGSVARYCFVSFEVRVEWLSSINWLLYPSGYFSSSIFRKLMKSELLWLSLTKGIASPISRSIPASRDNMPLFKQVFLADYTSCKCMN